MINSFSQSVIEKLDFYVYCLIDPRNSQVFYIGKGYGNRVFSHMNEALSTETQDDKLQQIREIKSVGLYPKHYILRHGLGSKEALIIESTLIDFSRLCEGFEFKLKNLCKGHKSFDKGLKTATDIIHYYDAEVVTIEDPAIIIIVNNLYSYGMTPDELYQVTKEKWRLDKNRIKNVKYVISAYLGIVREVYKVNEWYETFDERTKKYRYGFNGEIAQKEVREKYINGSLDNYKSNGTAHLYANC